MLVSFVEPDGRFSKFIPPHRSKRTSTGADDFMSVGYFGHVEISRLNEGKNKNARKIEELTNQAVVKEAENVELKARVKFLETEIAEEGLRRRSELKRKKALMNQVMDEDLAAIEAKYPLAIEPPPAKTPKIVPKPESSGRSAA